MHRNKVVTMKVFNLIVVEATNMKMMRSGEINITMSSYKKIKYGHQVCDKLIQIAKTIN